MLSQRHFSRSQSSEASRSSRETIHDLRNLFGVVASASHMLEDGPPPERKAMLIGAIEDAATRGAQLTTDLLGHVRDQSRCATVDLNEEMRCLDGLIRALAGSRAEIRMEQCEHPLLVKISRSGFEATILELVTNACAAFRTPGCVTIRTRRAGRRAWVIVADDAGGMSAAVLQNAMAHSNNGSGKGNGLNRVCRFAAESHGRVHLRSREGLGTVAAISWPLMLGLTKLEP